MCLKENLYLVAPISNGWRKWKIGHLVGLKINDTRRLWGWRYYKWSNCHEILWSWKIKTQTKTSEFKWNSTTRTHCALHSVHHTIIIGERLFNSNAFAKKAHIWPDRFAKLFSHSNINLFQRVEKPGHIDCTYPTHRVCVYTIWEMDFSTSQIVCCSRTVQFAWQFISSRK